MTRREVVERCLANFIAIPPDEILGLGLEALPTDLRWIDVAATALSLTDVASAIRVSIRKEHVIELVLIDCMKLLTAQPGAARTARPRSPQSAGH